MAASPSQTRPGFTLIEMLVTMAVIALLIAIVVPVLAGARGSARETACLSNLRGIGISFETYLQAHKSSYPFAPPETSFIVSPDPQEPTSSISPGYWDLTVYWPSLFHSVAPWREHFRNWICPGSPRAPGEPWKYSESGLLGVPSYRYCAGYLARPDTWSGTSGPDLALIAPVRLADVTFPASKALAFDEEQAHLPASATDRDRTPVLFADGHARTHRRSSAATPVVNPFRGRAEPLHDTPMGARGRDY